MSSDWAKPCPDSGNRVFNSVHEWMTQRAHRRRSRVVRADWLSLIDAISRERGHTRQEISNALSSLLDQGWIEKVDEGFLVIKKFPGSCRLPGSAGGERGSLVAKRLGAEDANFPLVAEAKPNGVKQESAQKQVGKPRVDLCRHFFPDLVESRRLETIPREMYWRPLYSQVKKMQMDYGVNLSFVRRMMEEFVRHPTWCERSRRPAWQVFIGRREELIKRVRIQQGRNTRHSGGAEYWLGKYAPA